MGEKQENDKKSHDGEKKNDGGGVITSVFKFDMHCEGCAKKVRRSIIKSIQGVENVKTDFSANKLVVTGKVDPVKIKEIVEEKTKKKVELVSPQPSKTPKAEKGGDGEKKAEEKKPEVKKSEEKSDEKKSEDKMENEKVKEKPKEPSVATVQLKTKVHCDGCANKIKKIVSKCEGVQVVNVDLQKDLITAKGTMNMKELLPYLNTKLKRTVELAPTKKADGGGSAPDKPKDGGDKSEKPKEGDKLEKSKEGGDKSEKTKEGGDTSSTKDTSTKFEVNKMEYSPFSYDYGYAPMIYDPRPQGEGYNHQVMEYWQAPEYSHPPQMFSDENPNACSVM